MKRNRTIVMGIAITVIALLVSSIACFPNSANKVFAGATRLVVDNASITSNGINAGSWYYKGVELVDNHATFKNADGLLFSKTKSNNLSEYGLSKCIDMEFTLKFTSISNIGLSVGIGVEKINLSTGYAKAAELNFAKKDNSISLTVNKYNAQNTASALTTVNNLPLNTGLCFNVEVKSDGNLLIKYNKNGETASEIFNQKLTDFRAEGFIGFDSSVGTTAILESVNIETYRYDNATNVIDATENFDNGSFNSNIWISTHQNIIDYKKSSMNIKDGELLIENSTVNSFGTVYQYSNFEFCFDITKMRTTVEKDADGIEYLPNEYFGFGFGIEKFDQAASTTIVSDLWFEFDYLQNRYILFTESRLYDGIAHWEAYKIQPFEDGYNYWKEEDVKGRTISIKFTMIDGVFSYYSKYSDESWSENPIFTYDLGYTPLGSVMFTSSHKVNSMALDNFSIKNLDASAEDYAVDVGYQQNATSYEAFQYTDTWDDNDLLKSGTVIINTSENSGEGCNSSISNTLSLSVISAVGMFALLAIKRRRTEK